MAKTLPITDDPSGPTATAPTAAPACPRCGFKGDPEWGIRHRKGLNVCNDCGQFFTIDEELSGSYDRLCDGRGMAGDTRSEAGLPTSADFAHLSPEAMRDLLHTGALSSRLREQRGYDLRTLRRRGGNA